MTKLSTTTIRNTNPCDGRKGFTLIELMISVALSLILILGINAVFSISSQTVGIGMASSQIIRDIRSAKTRIDDDFANLNRTNFTEMPYLYIQSLNAVAFRDRQDEKSATSYGSQSALVTAQNVALTDYGTAGTVALGGTGLASLSSRTGTTAVPIFLNNRNHRVDSLSFFVQGLYSRQTGENINTNRKLISDFQSEEAMIWYGHTRQPDSPAPGSNPQWNNPQSSANYVQPGINAPPSVKSALRVGDNAYASSWILGRYAILMAAPNTQGLVLDKTGTKRQSYLETDVSNRVLLRPFGSKSANGNGRSILTGYCDVAGTTMESYRTTIVEPVSIAAATRDIWHYPLLIDGTSITSPVSAFRFPAAPFLVTQLNDLTLEEALTAPIFIRGCSQFCVEFAGDYVTQNSISGPKPAGNLAAQQDGTLDFDAVPVGNNAFVKRVRWYGMTRSIDGTQDTAAPPTANNTPDYRIVHPVNWHLTSIGNAALTGVPGNRLPFEKNTYTHNYDNGFPKGGTGPIDNYTCVWSPYDLKWHSTTDPNYATLYSKYPAGFMPWMIRITLRVDDPNGRLPEGQTVEWVFNLPHPSAVTAGP